jgi:adenine phosphoribosyltransferase
MNYSFKLFHPINIMNIEEMSKDLEFIKKSIRTIPNFPKQGIIYRDITTLIGNPEALNKTINIMVDRYKERDIDIVAGIEARGFIFGGILADRLYKSFVPIRKKGKLPHETVSQEYKLEYGTDTIEAHKDAISPGQKVLIVDDLLATGGTGQAAAKLVEKLQGKVKELAFVVGLPDLKGKEKLARWPIYTMLEFKGK